MSIETIPYDWIPLSLFVIVPLKLSLLLVGGGLTLSGVTEREMREENQNVPSQESIISIDNQNEPYTRSK